MKRAEFRNNAFIQIASALVKVMAEECDGILDNPAARDRLVNNAIEIVNEMDDMMFDTEDADPDDEEAFVGEDEGWEDSTENRCVMFKVRKDGDIQYHAVMGKDEKLERGGTKLMHACGKAFHELRKEHPEVTEVHFFTDDIVKMEN